MTYTTDKKKHGGYRTLKSFQTTTLVYDLTVEFCNLYMTYRSNPSYRTVDQMVQAARSGRQNIAEGSQASATSKKTEIKLVIEEGGYSENLFKKRLVERRESGL